MFVVVITHNGEINSELPIEGIIELRRAAR